MKNLFKFTIAIPLLGTLLLSSCEVDTYGPGYYEDHTNYEIGQGESTTISNNDSYNDDANVNGGTINVTDNGSVNKINLHNGTANLSGNAVVETDVNINSQNSIFTMKDNASINKLNMHGGETTISGNATIETDLNHNNGDIRFGDFLNPNDTVTIGNQYNISSSSNANIYINHGVVIVEGDLNFTNGTMYVSDGAKLIVRSNFNHNSIVYGTRNIEVDGEWQGKEEGCHAPYNFETNTAPCEL